MSRYTKRRRQLKAHDRGDNRHAKGVAWTRKFARVSSAAHSGKKPKVERETPRIDVEPLEYDRDAERPSLTEQIRTLFGMGGDADALPDE